MNICTIHILDEVNCRLEGLDVSTLSEMQKLLTYTVKGAYYMEKVRAKRWNGKVSLLKKSGMTYRHMLEKIIPAIQKSGYEIEIADYRPDYNIEIPEIGNDFFEGYSHGEFKGIMEPHQYLAINNITSEGGGLLIAATAAGKSIIIAGLAKLYYDYGKILIIVPRTDLSVDIKDTIKALGMSECGSFYSDLKEVRHITVTTWQSLENRPELFAGVYTVIIDETQSARGTILFNLLTGAGKNVPIRIGMTGTLPDDDLSKANIISALGPVVKEVTAKQLQDIGFLAACKIFILQYQDTEHFEYQKNSKYHQLYIDEIRWQWENVDRIRHLASFIKTIRKDGNTLVLVRNVEYGEALQSIIDNSIFLKGSDKTNTRRKVYKEVNESNNNVLIGTYGIASVGINIPRIFNMVMIEPGTESLPIIQSVGRALRKSYDKDSANIYHIGSDAKFSKNHLTEVIKIYKKHQYPFNLIEVNYE